MKIKNLDTKKQVIIVAEIGNNHEGSYDLAEEMIILASKSGVDAVKFQTYKTEYYVSNDNKDRFNTLKSFELSYKEFEKLSRVANDLGLCFISTPFDINSAQFLSQITDAVKISSGDNTFFPLISEIAKINKPIILSSGLLNLNKLKYVENYINEIRIQCNINKALAVLHCVSSYPVEPRFANLKAIKTLMDELASVIGYSDHTIGTSASIAAVSIGARIIEKHFTKDKNFSNFRDHQLSADPKEMKEIVKKIRQIEQMLGNGEKILQPSEKDLAPLVRRSIVAKKNIGKGFAIKSGDFTWVRPGGGLKPGDELKIIGKKINKNIVKGAKILLSDLE
tara:strand:- start:154 stop:1164 length:1011 start_codon:yes stop_codon:yes gene_type:complete